MTDDDLDTPMRMAAFEHVRRLGEIHDNLTANELKPGFVFQGERIPLINPQRGIFKPRQMRFLLSIKTVFPKPGGKVWYDDQREAHRQIFEGDETIDYAFMGGNPDAADNRWLREAFENRIPIIYFPRYRAWPLPGHAACIHFGVGRHGAKGARRVWCARSSLPGTTRERAGTPLRSTRRQAAATSGIVSRGRHQRLQRPLCNCRDCRSRCFWTPPISLPTRTCGSANPWCPTVSPCRKSITPPSTGI